MNKEAYEIVKSVTVVSDLCSRSKQWEMCQTFLSESQQNFVYFDDWIKLPKVT